MTQKFTLTIISLFAMCLLRAQTYTQGDVTLTLINNPSHDSTNCYSTNQLFYNITVQNSFVGDSVKVIDPAMGMVVVSEGNSTGQTPWQLMLPIYPPQYMSDLNLAGNMALFFVPDTKLISGADTIYNISNVSFYMVPNPCEVDTFSGRIYADMNNDCAFNTGDTALIGLVIDAEPVYSHPLMTVTSSEGYSNTDGRYTARVIKSWLTSVDAFMPPYYQFTFPTSTCSPAIYHLPSLPQSNIDFSLQCSGNVDLQAYGSGPWAVRPLQPFFLSTGVSNLGCSAVSGQLRLVLDPRVTYSAGMSSNVPNAINGDTLIWNFTNLSSLVDPQYWNSFFSSIYLTPANNVGIGDSLCFEVFTTVPANDINANNNYHAFCLRVVNSYDPNLKEVNPAGEGQQGIIPSTTTELTYTIHFQNTGNAHALNVIVYDTLDSHVQPYALQVVGASHYMQAEWIASNIVRFSFNNINLPDSGLSQAASQGHVTFRVKLQPVSLGTQIKNNAAIYFDSNAPIFTNTVLNTIGEPSAVATLQQSINLLVFPNPASETITIVSDLKEPIATLCILSTTGQLISSTPFNGPVMQQSISALPAGLYVVELQSSKGTVRVKLTKTGS